jgi:hypothetical protein
MQMIRREFRAHGRNVVSEDVRFVGQTQARTIPKSHSFIDASLEVQRFEGSDHDGECLQSEDIPVLSVIPRKSNDDDIKQGIRTNDGVDVSLHAAESKVNVRSFFAR